MGMLTPYRLLTQLPDWQKLLPAHPAGEFCHDSSVTQTGLYAHAYCYCTVPAFCENHLRFVRQRRNVASTSRLSTGCCAYCLILLEASGRADALHSAVHGKLMDVPM